MTDDINPEVLEGLGRYFAERQRQRDERVAVTYGALTKREQQLVREAAVMGYVRGSMAGEVAGRSGQRAEIPRDAAIVTEVIACCFSFDDLYPVINRVARRAERRRAAAAEGGA